MTSVEQLASRQSAASRAILAATPERVRLSAPRTGGASVCGLGDFGAVGSKNRSGGPGSVMLPSVACSTSMSSPWDRVCSHSYTSLIVRTRPAGTPMRSRIRQQVRRCRVRREDTCHQFDDLRSGCATRSGLVAIPGVSGSRPKPFAESVPQAFAAHRDLHGAIDGRETVRTGRWTDGGSPALRRPRLRRSTSCPGTRAHPPRWPAATVRTTCPSRSCSRSCKAASDAERAVHAGQQVGDRNSHALNVVGT